jgi:hypothetical protein
MANPHAAKARETSRDKFKAITGIGGGGHAFSNASHMKKPGDNGVLSSYNGHAKAHTEEAKAHGGRSKRRADHRARGGSVGSDSPQHVRGRISYTNPKANVVKDAKEGSKFARGGRTKSKGKAPENVTININQPPDDATTGKMPPLPPPPPAGGPPAPPPSPPPGGPPGGANPMAQGLGKGMGFARGGRAGHRKGEKAKIQGDTKEDFGHWRKHAAQNGRDKASFLTQAHTQGADKVQKRARGGRMTAGALSGVGRLEKAAISRRQSHR